MSTMLNDDKAIAAAAMFGESGKTRTEAVVARGSQICRATDSLRARAIVPPLSKNPAGCSLAVAGMPIGSRSMGGDRPDTYDVLLFGEAAGAIRRSPRGRWNRGAVLLSRQDASNRDGGSNCRVVGITRTAFRSRSRRGLQQPSIQVRETGPKSGSDDR